MHASVYMCVYIYVCVRVYVNSSAVSNELR